jgi:TolB-like protein/AraC-like DNA-binding protein/Tfp pilus assembly protein PilF
VFKYLNTASKAGENSEILQENFPSKWFRSCDLVNSVVFRIFIVVKIASMEGITSMNQIIIGRLTQIIHENLDKEDFGVNELAAAAGMSRSSVHRRLKYYTKRSASQFIREVRLRKAMEMLQQEVATASEISYRVGFNSPTYFNTCFHHYFGYPPGEVKKRNFAARETSASNGEDVPEISGGKQVNIAKKAVHWIKFSRGKFFMLSAVASVLFLSLVYVNLTFISRLNPKNGNRLGPRDKSIVVLPFKNLSDNIDNQYFAEGVMEDILNHLFLIKELKVISRTTGEHYRTGTRAAPKIGRELGVNFILEGSVQQREGMVRITVQLIDARNDRHIWSQKYDRKLDDIFFIQSSIAKQIADELQAVITSNEIQQIEKIPTKNIEAYNLYLKGRFFSNCTTRPDLKKGMDFYEMAIAADPKYALAYAGLADTYFIGVWWGWYFAPDGFRYARQFAAKALELDNHLSSAHATMGAVMCWSEWNWEEAEKEFLRAIRLDSNNYNARQYYSEYLDLKGKRSEARSQINLALGKDPFSPALNLLSSLYYSQEGKFDESLADCRKLEELNVDSMLINWRYFGIYCSMGEELKAFDILQKIWKMNALTVKDGRPDTTIYQTENLNGLIGRMIQLELRKGDPELMKLAKLYLLSGRERDAMNWLNKAWERRLPFFPKMINDPVFDTLRNEPRFMEILKQLGLSARVH